MRMPWRKVKLATLGLLGLVGVGLIWLAVANAAAEERVEKKLAELKAAGEPTSLAELARKPVPPEDNAATFLRRAAAGLEAIETAVEPGIDKLSKAERDSDWKWHRAPAGLEELLHKQFTEHAEAIALVEKAADCPEYDPQLNYDQSPEAFIEDYVQMSQDVRRPIRVLNYRVAMQLTDGEREQALDTCVTMFKLCRKFDQRPLLVNFLVALAVRGVAMDATVDTLRSGPLPEAAYERLETELARQDLSASFRAALRSDRAFGIDYFRELRSKENYTSLPGGKQDFYDYLVLFSELSQRVDRPYVESVDWLGEQHFNKLTDLMTPAIEATLVTKNRATAQLRCLRVLNALIRRELAGKTDVTALAELGLPADALVDPYNEQPLHVRREKDGWLVYAVGRNLKDDGGEVDVWGENGFEDVGFVPGRK